MDAGRCLGFYILDRTLLMKWGRCQGRKFLTHFPTHTVSGEAPLRRIAREEEVRSTRELSDAGRSLTGRLIRAVRYELEDVTNNRSKTP